MGLVEQALRLGRRGSSVRPLKLVFGIRAGGYSGLLQRALTDFGAEESFLRAAQRVKEHYGIEVSASAIRRISFQHGRVINGLGEKRCCGPARELITEMDGSLIPVVQRGAGVDGRRSKVLAWREVRLCCARTLAMAEPIYGATLGSVENASWLWRQTAQRAGLRDQTYVHGVGDGAGWIVDRFKENFGQQGDYLLDFFHVSEYLAAAGKAIKGEKKCSAWLRRQQGRLLKNQWSKVLRSMEAYREPLQSKEAPVRAAWRYLRERTGHLDFQRARRRNLPIGSGEIESAHRHVIQKRLKLAGSWWKETNAQAMINLRTARANHDWNTYWNAN